MLKNFNIKKIKLDKVQLMEIFNKVKAQYDKDAIIYTGLLIAMIAYCVPKFVLPPLEEFDKNLEKLKEKKAAAILMEKKIEAATKRIELEMQSKNVEIPIKIYESQYKDVELENAATGLVNRIISLVKENGDNKVDSFDFEKKELIDDSGLKSKDHSLLRLRIKMETTYENVQNIINEIYLLEYLVGIDNISLEVNPESNYKRVTTYLVLDLFIKAS